MGLSLRGIVTDKSVRQASRSVTRIVGATATAVASLSCITKIDKCNTSVIWCRLATNGSMIEPSKDTEFPMAKTPQTGKSKRAQTKDRVLQARIPQKLDDELRGQAEELGLSVSTVVRNVLLNTFDLVEGVVTDSARIARAIQGRDGSGSSATVSRAPGTTAPPSEVVTVGWQEATLNLNGICDTCNTILPKGDKAAMGVPVQATPILLCLPCLADLQQGSVVKTTRPRKIRKDSPPSTKAAK